MLSRGAGSDQPNRARLGSAYWSTAMLDHTDSRVWVKHTEGGAVGDLNGDEKLDVVTTNLESNSVTVLLTQ